MKVLIMIAHQSENSSCLPSSKTAVLLVNLGTPTAPDYRSVRKYLKEFLSDKRVVELPRYLWWPILNLIILRTRPQKSARAYARIWNRERDESPLLTITRAQKDKLLARFEAGKCPIIIDFAMRYGTPSIKERIDSLIEKGVERLLVFALYPHYSSSTTASVNDAVFAALKERRFQPALRFVPPYYKDPTYIGALAQSVKRQLEALEFTPEIVLASYHGIPKSYAEKGDPYPDQCLETSRALCEANGWDEEYMQSVFQSRFGREEWLKPYADETIKTLAQRGVRKLAIFNPGFAADCLETLEEIDIENRAIFERNGGQHFAHISCLNDSEEGIDMLESLIMKEMAGWIS